MRSLTSLPAQVVAAQSSSMEVCVTYRKLSLTWTLNRLARESRSNILMCPREGRGGGMLIRVSLNSLCLNNSKLDMKSSQWWNISMLFLSLKSYKHIVILYQPYRVSRCTLTPSWPLFYLDLAEYS